MAMVNGLTFTLLLAGCAGAPLAPPHSYAYFPDRLGGRVDGFAIDPSSGAFTPVPGSPFPAGQWPDATAVTPNGAFLFVANMSADDISAYAIDRATGTLTQVPGSPFATGNSPSALTVSDNGTVLYAVNDGTDTRSLRPSGIYAYEIDAATGRLRQVAGSPFRLQGLASVATTHGGAYFYHPGPAGSTRDAVYAYVAEAGSGAPKEPIPGSPFTAGTGPTGAIVSPDGSFLYVANAISSDVSAYRIESNGFLSAVAGSPYPLGYFHDRLPTPAPDPVHLEVDSLAFTPDGAFLYVARHDDESITGYAVDATTGALSMVSGSPFQSGNNPSELRIAGSILYETNDEDNTSNVYRINVPNGSLSPIATYALGKPVVTISPISQPFITIHPVIRRLGPGP
jgi:6-phosphogluconolactonase (cycloisomerase 2 family)